MLPPAFKVHLPALVNLVNKIPHSHSDRFVSWVILDPIKLTVLTLMGGKRKPPPNQVRVAKTTSWRHPGHSGHKVATVMPPSAHFIQRWRFGDVTAATQDHLAHTLLCMCTSLQSLWFFAGFSLSPAPTYCPRFTPK